MTRVRIAASLLAAALCGWAGTVPVVRAEPSSAAGLCREMRGAWDESAATCTLISRNGKGADMTAIAKYSPELLDDPVMGPALTDNVRKFLRQFSSLDEGYVRSSEATLDYVRYERTPTDKSVLFKYYTFFGGAAHPNTALATFTFDIPRGRQLQLADLFCGGTDPDKVLPPYVRPYLQKKIDELNANRPAGNSPLTVDEFEPLPLGSEHSHTYVDSYDAWVLDGDSLLLFLPSVRLGPVGAGLFEVRVPLSTLRPVLRESCAA
ncbi:DUF3298 domain-containing protein [Mycobacteroides abscessus]|uniref:DUF3298 domain-containing protein n=1 Tax=Mycobacteroides abscessus TaxID=36809 RepID=UPI0009D10302|nr:DUF3298 domain-containing protein [Mycobacteroides abscessus]SKG13733.1 putative secreted protein [Mycobacteroides abscessus subsp. bolletii]SKG89004.1 putative secreted protein [Mycobacteroides abscessus subsp. bolletii]SKH42581.1 putative secreted protein [Mycobacteroides abscessus subsp. bolletii]SKH43450.1 putative secreted protein [Mycobacteroides abscessus subsp. bolletii]SKH52245.1 putative secreted protein [Mycobacteroides abscessus subsp. bolletii]